jgi:hypothetical protein
MLYNTKSDQSVRSIQIGLRGTAVGVLLDPTFVLQVSDVTQDFRNALEALQRLDLQEAEAALLPSNGRTESLR